MLQWRLRGVPLSINCFFMKDDLSVIFFSPSHVCMMRICCNGTVLGVRFLAVRWLVEY